MDHILFEFISNSIQNTAHLTGVVDWIISALTQFITKLMHTLFQPVFALIYLVVIYAPLQCIQAETILFKFFSNGFMSNLFGATISSSGHISYSFKWNSPLGIFIISIFILALFVFFINFMMSFTTNSVVDETGKPTSMQSKRFLYVKWPILIILLMVLTPFILCFTDYAISSILSIFSSDQDKNVSTDDLNGINSSIINFRGDGSSGLFAQLCNISSIGILNNTPMSTELANLQSKIQKALDGMDAHAGGGDDDPQFGILYQYLTDAKVYVDSLIKLINNGGLNTDKNTLIQTLNNVAIGQFLSTDNVTKINAVMDDLRTMQGDFYNLSSSYSYLTSNDSINGWNALINATSGDSNPFTIGDENDILNPLQDLASQLGINPGVSPISTTQNIAQFVSYNDSYLYHIQAGGTNYIGLSGLLTRVKGGEAFIMVKMLYAFATGDPNPDNWNHRPKVWSGEYVLAQMDILHWALTVFACFGMILIMYNFVSSVCKRTFYIVGYWILGWLFLANGMKNTAAMSKWYRSLFGRWISVIIMLICYEMATILIYSLKDPIIKSLNDYGGIFDLGGMHWIAGFGMVFVLETAYQTAWQISESYLGEFGAQTETFSAAQSMFMTQGKGLAFGTLNSAKNIVTAKAVRDHVSDAYSSLTWNRDRKDKDVGRQNTYWQAAQRKYNFKGESEKAKKAGYKFKMDDRGKYTAHKKEGEFGAGGGSGGGGGAGGGSGGGGAGGSSHGQVFVPKSYTTPSQEGQRLKSAARTAGQTIQNKWDNFRDGFYKWSSKSIVGRAAIGIGGLVGGKEGRQKVKKVLQDPKQRTRYSTDRWYEEHGINTKSDEYKDAMKGKNPKFDALPHPDDLPPGARAQQEAAAAPPEENNIPQVPTGGGESVDNEDLAQFEEEAPAAPQGGGDNNPDEQN